MHFGLHRAGGLRDGSEHASVTLKRDAKSRMLMYQFNSTISRELLARALAVQHSLSDLQAVQRKSPGREQAFAVRRHSSKGYPDYRGADSMY